MAVTLFRQTESKLCLGGNGSLQLRQKIKNMVKTDK